jgi:hypothetical protein
MNRLTLSAMMGCAVMTVSTATTMAQQGQARYDDEATYPLADAAYSPTLPDAAAYPWGTDSLAGAAEPRRPGMAPAPLTSATTTFSTLDWLDELDRRVTRQDAAISHAFSWTQRVLAVLVLLFGGCIVYLWVRMAQLAANGGQVREPSDLPVAARQQNDVEVSTASRPSVAATRLVSAQAPHSTSPTSIPRVQFLSGVIDRLVGGINESRHRRGGVETGYALVGKIVGDGLSRTIIVSGLIDEGPASERSGGHHQADREYQRRELELLQLADGDVMFIGDAHLHPGSLDTCSAGDYRTDLANVRESHSQEMVFVIATATSAHWGNRSPESVYQEALKVDFYYMGKASAYQYRRFRPEVVQGPALSVPIELRRFAAADPIRARLDFDNLRRLTGYRMTLCELPVDGQRSRHCIVMTHKSNRFKAMIAFSGDPQERPDVFVERESQVVQFQPSYLNGGGTPGVVWFTPSLTSSAR